MSSDMAIKVENLSKIFQIYEKPRDRLKQLLLPWLHHKMGLPPVKYCKEFSALKDLSFEVMKGETVGIIGHNGAGKSTLLQMICGTLNPTGGSVKTNGRVAALLELGSGFNPDFTGRENVYMNASVLGLTVNEIDMCFDEIVKFADIGDFIEQPVKTYSSGMMMRLAFAVAINVSPDILIVDEVLAVGDEAFQRKCFARIEHIKRAGSTILFVTHATQTVVELCDRAIFLRNGDLVYFGHPSRAVSLYYSSTNQYLNGFPNSIISGDKEEIFALDNKSLNNINVLANGAKSSLLDQYWPSEDEPKSCYDPSLVSATMHQVHNDQYGITISKINLKNNDLECINVLNTNQSYILAFNIDVIKFTHDMSIQILFKNINGIPVAGDRFFYGKVSGKDAPIGKTQQIRYLFECSLNPGVYFISIEASSGQGNDHVIYHKLAEALAFRVRTQRGNTAIGYASMKSKIEIEVVE